MRYVWFCVGIEKSLPKDKFTFSLILYQNIFLFLFCPLWIFPCLLPLLFWPLITTLCSSLLTLCSQFTTLCCFFPVRYQLSKQEMMTVMESCVPPMGRGRVGVLHPGREVCDSQRELWQYACTKHIETLLCGKLLRALDRVGCQR